jgi:hypothetical protein
MMNGQQSLTLRWRSISRWGGERITLFFIGKDSKYFVYDCVHPVAPQIIQDTWYRNRWRSVDAHCHDGAGRFSHSLLPMKVANTMCMTLCNLSPPRLSQIHDHEWWTLHWRSLSWCGRECFTFSFAYEGSQYYVFDYLQPFGPQDIQDTWPRIVDALLTLIFMMGQGAFHCLFCI